MRRNGLVVLDLPKSPSMACPNPGSTTRTGDRLWIGQDVQPERRTAHSGTWIAFLLAAIEEAELGLSEGGIPIGSGPRPFRGHRRPWPQSPRATGQHGSPRRDGRARQRGASPGLVLPCVHSLHHALALLHVQRRHPALWHPAHRHRRETCRSWARSSGFRVAASPSRSSRTSVCMQLMRAVRAGSHPSLWAEDIGGIITDPPLRSSEGSSPRSPSSGGCRRRRRRSPSCGSGSRGSTRAPRRRASGAAWPRS